MIKASIVGATGYTGEELISILLDHPEAEITALTAKIDKPSPIAGLCPKFKGKTDLVCGDTVDVDAISAVSDFVFLALPHTVSVMFAPAFIEKGVKVIDLSADYRLPAEVYSEWYNARHEQTSLIDKAVYGLPELFKNLIREADLIANPGCYPTSVILGAAPVFSEGVASSHISVDSKSGVTGAGRKAMIPLLFAEVNESVKAYKIGKHQHMPEMSHYLSHVSKSVVDVLFVPHLIPVNRGILSTMYIDLTADIGEADIFKMYKDFFSDAPFVRVYGPGEYPATAQVVGTNYCDIGLAVRGKKLVVVSCIDNLKKGAAGQAVQNMNIMAGIDEKSGLL